MCQGNTCGQVEFDWYSRYTVCILSIFFMKTFFIGSIGVILLGIGIFFFLSNTHTTSPPPGVSMQQTQINTPQLPPDEIPATEETTAPPEIIVQDQAYQDSGITIQSVQTEEDIWLVAYDDDNDKPGRIIGQVRLSPGTWSDVAFPISEQFLTKKIYIVVHKDVGQPNVFEFPGADVALSMNGVVLVKTVHLQ